MLSACTGIMSTINNTRVTSFSILHLSRPVTTVHPVASLVLYLFQTIVFSSVKCTVQHSYSLSYSKLSLVVMLLPSCHALFTGAF